MTDFILTAIVVLTAINAMVTARYSLDQRRIKIADYGMRVAVWAGLTSLLALALWVSLAVMTGRWQFAAIVAVPLLITVGSIVAKPREDKAGTRDADRATRDGRAL